MSAALGEGNAGIDYVLRKQRPPEGSWIRRLFEQSPEGYSYRVPDRDEGGARALSELEDRGINSVANALGQSVDHIVSFFTMLRTELAFYIGCLNLHAHLAEIGEPVGFPQPATTEERVHSATGLYDVCLALKMERPVIGNDLNAEGKDLVIITGANQGGKSTFLRVLNRMNDLIEATRHSGDVLLAHRAGLIPPRGAGERGAREAGLRASCLERLTREGLSSGTGT